MGDSYLFAWSDWPEEVTTSGPAKPRQQALVLRQLPSDGGQLFYPLHVESFVAPLDD